MGAHVEHKFERGYILDEERLRKIHNLLESRISKYSTPLSPQYKVFRGDSLSYETGSVEDVVNEDNDDWRAITRVELFAEQGEVFRFRLTFAKDTVSLFINGDDRDAVFLLFSDVREYIRNEILAGRKPNRDVTRAISFLIALGPMIAVMFYLAHSTRVDTALASKALSTNDLAEKINFLVRNAVQGQSPVGWLPWVMLLTFVTVALSDSFVKLWRFLFPTDLFLFGKRKVQFEKRRSLVSKLFWGVAVSLAVSALAGILVWRLTSK